MSVVLPTPIAAYFAADQADGASVAPCFTDDAVVRDEGRTYTGRAAIAGWKADTSNKYTYSSTPVALDGAGGKTIVTCHLVGDFPGSPIDLRYAFDLADDKIAALEIKP